MTALSWYFRFKVPGVVEAAALHGFSPTYSEMGSIRIRRLLGAFLDSVLGGLSEVVVVVAVVVVVVVVGGGGGRGGGGGVVVVVVNCAGNQEELFDGTILVFLAILGGARLPSSPGNLGHLARIVPLAR